MSLITLAETKGFLNIASTETAYDDQIRSFLPLMPERVAVICNRAFTVQPLVDAYYGYEMPRAGLYYSRRWYRDTSLYVLPLVSATFDASSATVTARDENFASAMFATEDDIFIKASYQNDGYYEVDSVSTSTLTIASTLNGTGSISFTDEATGATVYFAVVKWPSGIKPLVASLIQFDYQERGSWKNNDNYSYGVYGYPKTLLRDFLYYTTPVYGAARDAG